MPPGALRRISLKKEVIQMLGSWAKRTFTKERVSFALSVTSLFLLLGLLMYWIDMALQHP